MIELAAIPFFADLAAQHLERLRAQLGVRRYAVGEAVMRRGDPGLEFHIVAEGVAAFDLDPDGQGRPRRVALGAGQALGEMATLSGMPVSATVTALQDLATYCLEREAFLALLDEHPILYKRVTEMLIDRLRHRTAARAFPLRGHVAAITIEEPSAELGPLHEAVQAIFKCVEHYAPGSAFFDARNGDEALAARVQRWRESGAGSQYLVVLLGEKRREQVLRDLTASDVWLRLVASQRSGGGMSVERQAMLDQSIVAHRQLVVLGDAGFGAEQDWAFRLPESDVQRCLAERTRWQPGHWPTLDRIARYVTYREVGVAMSVGAAAGYAHFGVMQVLEELGIPLDYLCGASMGGIAAMTCARFGSAAEAARHVCEYSDRNTKVRDPAWLPRRSLMVGQKTRQAADELFGRLTFADLDRPVAVVAADLVAGKPVVLHRGPLAAAARATAAIPGLFPPVLIDSRMLVDGGVVSRIPVDELGRRRCGHRIAVTVVPERSRSANEIAAENQRLQAETGRLFGFRHVLGISWNLLTSWDARIQAQKADQVIVARTPWSDSYNFDATRRMVEVGRRVGEAHAREIVKAVREMLAPGVP